MEPLTLYRAPWIVPVSSPVVKDGAVLVKNNLIVAVGSSAALLDQNSNCRIQDHPGSILTPSLVNAHIHLELSHLQLARQQNDIRSFTGWITSLLKSRDKDGTTGERVESSARQLMLEQYQQGVDAIGDIGNTLIGDTIGADFPGTLMHFHEFLGRSAKSCKSIRKQLDHAPPYRRCTAHAPYSTYPELIQLLKNRANSLGHPFPIHVAEPDSERELLCCGTGELYEFLREHKFIDSSYQPPAQIDKQGSVKYLQSLGILDERTICVHCVHVSDEEVKILADSGSGVCLCPGSNRYLHVGRAPVPLFLRHGILPALGTDSTASNPEISIWREMRLISEDNPDIDHADIFAMATLGGANVLHLSRHIGCIEPGRSANLLAIRSENVPTSSPGVFELLVRHNEHILPTRILEP